MISPPNNEKIVILAPPLGLGEISVEPTKDTIHAHMQCG